MERRGCTQWRQGNASIHIHPGVATGALITCFNLPAADWASICHSKSVIAPATAAVYSSTPSNQSLIRGRKPAHVAFERGWLFALNTLPLLSYCSFSTFTLAFRLRGAFGGDRLIGLPCCSRSTNSSSLTAIPVRLHRCSHLSSDGSSPFQMGHVGNVSRLDSLRCTKS